ncbi:MAG: cysteine desulfurase [Myxococcales bacterium]|nr:cysteine desulfurase [Myxococcales bacterium]
MRPIYLDNAATTPLDPAVAEGLAERHRTLYGNPGSSHPIGRAAGRALDEARARLARRLGGQPQQVVFTSGGTESLGLALLGAAGDTPGRVAISAVEHSAVVEAAATLGLRGWQVDIVPVDAAGRVTPEALRAAIGRDTRLIAVMLANNEIGTINDVPALAAEARAGAPRAKIVVDAVQAFGKVPFSVATLGADCVAVTAHKIHGPKGIGALWTRAALRPVLRGGGQEFGLRGGTPSAPLAWALAEAAERMPGGMDAVTALRDRLWAAVRAAVPTARLTGPALDDGRLGNNLHLCIPGLPSEPLLNALAEAGVCASAGSTCSKGRFSRTLSALGHTKDEGAWLRLTPGRLNTADEMDEAARRLGASVAALRAVYD